MAIKEKLVQHLDYKKKTGENGAENNVQLQQTQKTNQLASMLAGNQGAADVSNVQKKSSAGQTQGKSSVWNNFIRNCFISC